MLTLHKDMSLLCSNSKGRKVLKQRPMLQFRKKKLYLRPHAMQNKNISQKTSLWAPSSAFCFDSQGRVSFWVTLAFVMLNFVREVKMRKPTFSKKENKHTTLIPPIQFRFQFFFFFKVQCHAAHGANCTFEWCWQNNHFSHLLGKSSHLHHAGLWLTHGQRRRRAHKYSQSFSQS